MTNLLDWNKNTTDDTFTGESIKIKTGNNKFAYVASSPEKTEAYIKENLVKTVVKIGDKTYNVFQPKTN